MKKLNNRYMLAMLSALSLGTAPLWAQTAPKEGTVPVQKDEKADEDVITLSPFVVSAEEDDGYLATATLAGSRVRTEMKDIASSITVVTKQFMNDIGAVNNTSLLTYTTNTEVGGLYGNFAGVGNTFIDGAAEGPTNLLRPQTNTRVRGLDSADNTRDYFLTDIPWDGYNIGRVDMQRGPNSILFGIGSPAGIVNTSVNTAGYKTEGYVQNRIDKFGSLRNSADYNQVLVSKELAVRIAAVDDYSKYRQKPAFNRNRRVFGALRWDPQFFGKDSSARTSIRANTEHGEVKANRPRSLPPIDRLTPFFDTDKVNKQFYDAQDADAAGILAYRTKPGAATNYWIAGGRGLGEWDSPVVFFNNTATPNSAQQGRPRGGQYASSGAAFGNFFPVGITTYNAWATDLDRWGPTNGLPASVLDPVAGASKGFYKTKQIIDPNIFDFYNILLDGPNKKEWQGWKSFNAALEQTFFNNRVGFEAVYDRQKYHDGSEGLLGWAPSLSVDIMKNTMQYPGVYTDLAVKNPNAGRVYTSGSGSGGSRETDRENIRFTAFGELRAKDYLGDGRLSRILGRHIVTALYSQEQYDTEDRSWKRYAASNAWTDLILNPARRSVNEQVPAPMGIEQITYLTGNVTGFASASQLHIPGIAELQAPPSTLSAKYYDSHWKWPTDPSHPDYVDPNAVWSNPTGSTPTPNNSTQASNPANYVGWVDTTINVLNADKGDINDLYTSASKHRAKTYSRALTWQAYLLDDVLVGTGGWRRDTIKIRAGYPDQEIITKTGIPSMNYGLDPQEEDGVKSGENVSWGVVAHLPKKLREKLPWGSNISVGFNNSNNNRVENRYGFSGQALPNAKGHSRDYSLVLSTLDDRLTLKVAYYKT
ncbi:MAG TPA: TonB-dependent receptor plug domain-containing protein, partial [Lacunisphaera sp.]